MANDINSVVGGGGALVNNVLSLGGLLTGRPDPKTLGMFAADFAIDQMSGGASLASGFSCPNTRLEAEMMGLTSLSASGASVLSSYLVAADAIEVGGAASITLSQVGLGVSSFVAGYAIGSVISSCLDTLQNDWNRYVWDSGRGDYFAHSVGNIFN